MVLPPAAPPQRPGPRGVAPLRPLLPGTIQAGPGPAGDSAPTHSYLRRPPLCHPSPQPRPVEKKRALGPHALKTSCKFTPTPPAPSTSSPGRGPCPPRPLPPGYIRSRRSRPQPGPEGGGLEEGSQAPRAAPRSHAPDEPGRLDGRRGGWQCGAHGLAPFPVDTPTQPPTCLADPRDRSSGAWVGVRALRAPLPPGPAHLAMKVNPSAARAPRLQQLVPSSGVGPRAPPAAPSRAPRLRATGEARPRPPCPLQSAPPPLPTSSPRPASACHRAPRPAPGLLLSLGTHFPPRPAEGSTLPPRPRPSRLRPSPPLPPVCLLQSPLGNVVLPAGRRSARHVGICSPTPVGSGLCWDLAFNLETLIHLVSTPFASFLFSE